MTTFLKTSTAALVAALALAGVAQAEGVHVNIAGKSPAMIHAEIVQAAKTVCAEASAIDSETYGSVEECVPATIAATQLKVAGVHGGFVLAKREALSR
jgi:hypothetical protein